MPDDVLDVAAVAADPQAARARTSVLIVDDDADHAQLVRRVLLRHDPPFDVELARDGLACLDVLARRDFSAVLLDYRLPRMNGLEVLAEMRARGLTPPVVIATAQGDERVAVEAMKAGAIDYVVKSAGYFQTLPTVLNKVLEQHQLAREHARLLEESRRQQCQLAQIFDSTSDAILLVDGHGRLMHANRRAGEFFGFVPDAATGRDLASLLPVAGERDADTTRFLAFLAARPPHGTGELRLGPRVLHWTGQRVGAADEPETSLTLTLHDLTEERRVGQMKSDFVSFVAHQLRTPLSGIKWMLELAAAEREPEMLGSLVADAAASADRLIAMVNDLLNISRLEGGGFKTSPEPVDLEALTGRVLEDLHTLAEERQHRVSVSVEGHAPTVIADRELLHQVFVNLVSNAFKYTPPGGEIEIRMWTEADTVCWSARDTGIGIPEEARLRVFEKFYRADNATTLDADGTGLGLYLVALTTRYFGGDVSCTSEEGKGSTFLLQLPAPR